MIEVTKSPKGTQKFAGFFVKKIKELGRKNALVIALEGELGAGKTTFIQGLAKALKIKAKIKSPTFNLMKKYKIAEGNKLQAVSYLYHFDCYRLRDHRDLIFLGIKGILQDPKNIVLIEWSERVKKILPKRHIKVHIDHISKNERKITVILSPPSLKLRKGTSSLVRKIASGYTVRALNKEMPALRSSEGAKK